MSLKHTLLEIISKRPLIIDGAMGTQLQERADKGRADHGIVGLVAEDLAECYRVAVCLD